MCGIFGVIQSNYNKQECFTSSLHIQPRGPERSLYTLTENMFLCFHRLAIINPSPIGDQPFVYESLLANGSRENYYVLCNGQIYNYKSLIKQYLPDVRVKNDIDAIYYLFEHFYYDFTRLNRELNGEYALVIFKMIDGILKTAWISTDTSSVRPLFIYTSPNIFAFSSLLIGLSSLSFIDKTKIQRLKGGDIVILQFSNESHISTELQTTYLVNDGLITSCKYINEISSTLITETLRQAVQRRLQSDREIGCLLSGGLDSSLVAALASLLLPNHQKLKTFSIGMKGGTDLMYARLVADHINSEHHEIIFTPEEGLNVINDVIRCCETYDITTIRASIPQYLLAKWISNHTNIKVVLNGDGADECEMGYLYFYNAPDMISAHLDSNRLVDEIHLYDGLRVDRNISHWGLEARVPFLDKHFTNLYKSIHPKLKVPIPQQRPEKQLIRNAFKELYPNLLPDKVLYRTKEAFSDAVSSREKSWYQMIQEYITEIHGLTEKEYYRNQFNTIFGSESSHLIPHYWMPSWSQTNDPSARTLQVYSEINE